jgi:hypothetical protein
MNLTCSSSQLSVTRRVRRVICALLSLAPTLLVVSSVEAASKFATALTTTAGDKQVTVGFIQPDLTPAGTSPTGSDVRLGYTIYVYQGGIKKGASDCVETSNTTESCIVTSYLPTGGGTSVELSNGTAYTFKVDARWSDGAAESLSTESASSPAATPFSVPATPDQPTVSANSTTATTADVTWIAPLDNGESIDLYTVTVFNKAGTTAATGVSGCTSSTLTCSVTGLTRGTAYTFKVKARNEAGDSLVSPVSAAFTVAPESPTSVSTSKSVSGSTATIEVTWGAPATNAEPITGYTVKATDGTTTVTKTWTSGDLKASFTANTSGADLTLGTRYTFTVLASNAGGDGTTASPTPADLVPSRAPDVPAAPSATFTSTTANVTWSAPSSNGGEAITEYTASAFASSATDASGTALGTCTSTGATSCAITGLSPSTGYKFAVKARNTVANGYSSFSGLSTLVTSPAAVVAPGAPTSAAATFSGTTAAVTWLAPASNGGEAITEYTAAAFASTATNTSGTPLGTCTSSGALTCSIQNLSYGTTYKFAVKAKNNSAGYGLYSSLTAGVTAPAAPVTQTPVSNTPVVTPVVATPPAAPTVETTAPPATTAPVVSPTPSTSSSGSSSSSSSLSGTPVSISREPSSAISANTEIALSTRTVKLLLEVPKGSNAKTQVTKYIIELKPTKGAVIKRTVTVKAGQTVKPTLSGKAKTTYTVYVTAVQKSGKKSVWKGPKVTTK